MKFRDYTKYEVFEDGRIWSYSHKKFLKPSTLPDGYRQVCLTDNEGKKKMYLVHRVIFEAVTGNKIPKCMQCNHINEDKTDNRFCNLNLLTQKDNINFGTRTERARKAMTNGKLSKQVGAFKNGKLVLSFNSTQEAQRQGFNQCAVSMCCRNCYSRPGNNVYKGFQWKFI